MPDVESGAEPRKQGGTATATRTSKRTLMVLFLTSTSEGSGEHGGLERGASTHHGHGEVASSHEGHDCDLMLYGRTGDGR